MNTYTINLDWFEITVIGKIFDLDVDIKNKALKNCYELGRLLLKRKHEKLHGYRCKYELQIDDENVGYLLYRRSDSKAIFTSDYSSRIHLYNNILYQENWYDSLNTVLQILGLKFNNYYRLDIAIDSYNLIQKFNTLYRSPEYQLIRNLKPRGTINKNGILTGSIKIGSEYSDKKISIYAKEELLKKHYKSHILDSWYKNNLTPLEGKQIDRVELQLNNDASKHIELNKLTETKYLSSVAKQGFKSMLRFLKINESQRNPSRWEVKEFIEWDILETTKVKSLCKAVATKTIVPKKTTVQHLHREYNSSCQTCLMEAMEIIIKRYNLEDYYKKNHIKWG